MVGADARVVDTPLRIRIAGSEDASELARLKESWANLTDPAAEAELAEFAETMTGWYSQIRRLPPGGWKQMAKMGGMVSKLVGGGK